ncbi:MAG TPA: hypothetical protein PK364_03105 [Synergistaceae bacterium]|nr:hypothetical protein [Synergistaceae bacterium]HPJ25345.1 hypothetical protein [Synergistaceae bacterium]HPQ38051.1 hypothetical protein [Synergistaceae bacterium]
MPWTKPKPLLSKELGLRQAPLPFLLSELDLLLAPLASLEDLLRQRLDKNLFGTLHPPAWTAGLHNLEPWEEENAVAPETLEEHLLPQIALCPGVPEEISDFLGERLLLWVNSRGYLQGDIPEMAASLGMSASGLENLVPRLQAWVDPPGLLARNLEECLRLQLLRQQNPSPDALELLDRYTFLLEKGNFEKIRHATRWSSKRLEKALEALRKLDPSPGSSFRHISYVHPEIEITLEGGKPRLRFLRENLPQLRIDGDILPWRHEPRLQRQWKEMVHLATCLALRCRSRLLVTREASEAQRDFLAAKQDAPAPLTLTQTAAKLSFSPSTVHRIARATWLRTPRGTLPLEQLFSRPLRSRPDLSVAQLRLYLEKHAKEKRLSSLAKELGIPSRTLSWHLLQMRRKK